MTIQFQKHVVGPAASDRLANAATLVEVDITCIMTAEAPGPTFVIPPFVPRGYTTLLGGHGGAGKSMLAMVLAAHVACGKGWAGFEVSLGKALFISMEDNAAVMRHRLRLIVEQYGLDPELIEANLRLLDGTASGSPLAAEMVEYGRRTLQATATLSEVEAAARGTDFIIVDNASDAFEGDENSRRQVRAFVRMLSSIAMANNAGLMLLAHIDKQAARNGSAGNSYSGSTAWHNSARSRLALLDHGGDLELRHEKLNLGKVAMPTSLSWSDSGVLIPDDSDTSQNNRSSHLAADMRRVFEAIQEFAANGVPLTTARSGVATIVHAVEHHPSLADFVRTSKGKRRFYAALDSLEAEGRIERRSLRVSHRNKKETWVAKEPVGNDFSLRKADSNVARALVPPPHPHSN